MQTSGKLSWLASCRAKHAFRHTLSAFPFPSSLMPHTFHPRHRTFMRQFLQTTIRYGLRLLLIWTPLAFGAVHSWAFALLEIHIFLLVVAWMVQIIVSRRQPRPASRAPTSFVRTPLALPLVLFLVLLMFQLTPLLPALLKRLSPTTYEL